MFELRIAPLSPSQSLALGLALVAGVLFSAALILCVLIWKTQKTQIHALDGVAAQISAITAQVSTINAHVQANRAQIAANSDIISTFPGRLASLADHAEKLSTQIDRVNAQVQANMAQIAVKSDVISTFPSRLASLADHSEKLSAEIGRVSEQIRLNSPADLGNSRLDVRMFMIRSQLAQAKSSIIVIGDSITEAALFPSSLCGHTIINAGVGGMTVPSYLAIAKQVLPREPAALIVIALGTNDSANTISTFPTIEATYSQLLDVIRQHSEKVVLAGIPPFDMKGELAASYFDQAAADSNNTIIRKVAAANNLDFIDLHNDIRGDHQTLDGIHLNAAGYTQWRGAVLSHVRSSLGCFEAGAN